MPLQLRASLLAAFAISITSFAVRAIPFLLQIRENNNNEELKPDDLRQLLIQIVFILAMNLNGMFIVKFI